MVRIATWTAPRTWVSGEIVTAANMNTHVRDNLTTMTQAWTSYTPTWTGSLGNGTILGAYQRVGITVHFRASVNWGSTTSHPAALQSFTLPVAAAGWYTTYGPVGQANCVDFSAGPTQYLGPVMLTAGSTTTVAAFALTNWGGATPVGFPTNLVPFTWAVNDIMLMIGTYEAATL